MIDRKDEYQRMSKVEERHWWYRCLHDLVLDAISKNFNSKDIAIIDSGCGTGGAIKYLLKKGYAAISGFDLSPHAVEICQSQKIPVKTGNIKNISKLYKKNSAQVIICNDVFYFLSEAERKQTIQSYYEILTKDGIVIMNLPSLDMFKGAHDIAVGIDKRFTKKMIRRVVSPDLFSFSQSRYWPFLLSPVILAIRLFQRLMLAVKKNSEITSDVAMPAKFLNSIFYSLISFENRFLPWKPLGSSLLVVLKKK